MGKVDTITQKTLDLTDRIRDIKYSLLHSEGRAMNKDLQKDQKKGEALPRAKPLRAGEMFLSLLLSFAYYLERKNDMNTSCSWHSDSNCPSTDRETSCKFVIYSVLTLNSLIFRELPCATAIKFLSH